MYCHVRFLILRENIIRMTKMEKIFLSWWCFMKARNLQSSASVAAVTNLLLPHLLPLLVVNDMQHSHYIVLPNTSEENHHYCVLNVTVT